MTLCHKLLTPEKSATTTWSTKAHFAPGNYPCLDSKIQRFGHHFPHFLVRNQACTENKIKEYKGNTKNQPPTRSRTKTKKDSNQTKQSLKSNYKNTWHQSPKEYMKPDKGPNLLLMTLNLSKNSIVPFNPKTPKDSTKSIKPQKVTLITKGSVKKKLFHHRSAPSQPSQTKAKWLKKNSSKSTKRIHIPTIDDRDPQLPLQRIQHWGPTTLYDLQNRSIALTLPWRIIQYNWKRWDPFPSSTLPIRNLS